MHDNESPAGLPERAVHGLRVVARRSAPAAAFGRVASAWSRPSPQPFRRRRLLTIGHSYSVTLNRRLAHELALTGEWEVTVVAPSRFRGDFGWHVATASPHERCHLETVPVRLGRTIHVMTYGRRLRELLQQPWDLVHCWEEPYVAAAAQVAGWTPPRVPLAFATFQNLDKPYPPPFKWFEHYALQRADGLVAFGHTVLDVAVAHGFAPGRARVIPPGVDTQRFAPNPELRAEVRASLGWRDETPVVGFVGRFVPEKGLALLTAALDRLRVPWRALFVGSGPLGESLRAWAAPYGARVAIVAAAHDEIPAWLNAMDLLCAPSQTTRVWREQFGRMLIEAFGVAVPVVASRSGEIPHVVADAGVLLPEHDPDAWTREITALIEDEGRRRELGTRGRARALLCYDWSIVAAQHAVFFSQIIDGTLVPSVTRSPIIREARG